MVWLKLIVCITEMESKEESFDYKINRQVTYKTKLVICGMNLKMVLPLSHEFI